MQQKALGDVLYTVTTFYSFPSVIPAPDSSFVLKPFLLGDFKEDQHPVTLNKKSSRAYVEAGYYF